MTRSVGRLGRFGGALLVLGMSLLLISVFSGEALADTFTANLTTDAEDNKPGNGKCDTVSDTPGQQCTLRAAVQEANALDGRDTVVLVKGTYLLTLPNQDRNGDGIPDGEAKAKTGDLDILDEMIIRGAGLGETTVQNVVNDRHFDLHQRAPRASISGLILTSGNSGLTGSNSGRGGGIQNAGRLALNNIALRENEAFFGGAIDNRGTLTMKGTTVSNNTALVFGGGIYNEGPLTVNDSTISNNRAIKRINDLGGFGGGIYNTTATAKLTNSTIASNTAEQQGGGIYNEFGDVALNNVTVNENSTIGEGVSIANNESRTYLKNTIVAKGATALGENCVGESTVSRGNNLSDDGSCNMDQPTDQSNKDPLLTPISDDDDTTALIFEPRPGSPAIDKAANRACPPADQRGVKRPKDGDGNGTTVCDVGSVEARPSSSGA